MRHYINIVEATGVHLPRKFWYHPNGDQFYPAGTHADDVLSDWQEMGLPEAGIRAITGSTSGDPTEITSDADAGDDDDDYEDDFQRR